MKQQSYLIFYDVNGNSQNLQCLLDMEADKYVCLGNLIHEDPEYVSDLEESLECLELFRSSEKNILFKNYAERNLLNSEKDTNNPNRIPILTLFQKTQIDYLFSSRTKQSNPKNGFCLLPQPPKNNLRDMDYSRGWLERDENLKNANSLPEIEAIELDEEGLYTVYGRLVNHMINYMVHEKESEFRDYNLFFMGQRNEQVIWTEGIRGANPEKPKTDKLWKPKSEKERYIITPGSLRYGHFCRLNFPELSVRFYNEADLRLTRETAKEDFLKAQARKKRKSRGWPYPTSPRRARKP